MPLKRLSLSAAISAISIIQSIYWCGNSTFNGEKVRLYQVPDLDTVVVCCGGGGLLAGVATAVKLLKPEARVIGVEPETACTMHRSLAQGKPASMPEAK